MRLIITFLFAVILSSCAQIIPLTGGIKDTAAPTIIPEKSNPVQGQLNYTNPELVLVFDEYIVLKNPLNNISITPQPTINPTITAKNKKLKIVFNEPLIANTTYSIAFNGAIADLNEGNDSIFQYVFSTGSFIDSLRFTGSARNAYTNKPEENVLVGLYPLSDTIPNDSIPYLVRPSYITQTDKNGLFELNYIKANDYVAYAYTDLDRNLLYNPNTEKIGFLDTIKCCSEVLSDSNEFKLFLPASTQKGIETVSLDYSGRLNLIFKEEKPEPFTIKYQSTLLEEKTGANDSLVYWLSTPYHAKAGFVFEQGTFKDTLHPIMKNLPEKGKNFLLEHELNLFKSKLLPNDTLSFTFSSPIQVIDKEGIKAFDKDSILIESEYAVKNIRTLQILPKIDSVRYVNIDSGAIKSLVANAYNSRINIKLEQHPANYYGQLFIALNTDQVSDYVLELLNAKGNIVASVLVKENDTVVPFSKLLPGDYQLRLTEDLDRNGLWTPGDVIKKHQPESVYYHTGDIKVRSNWDLEIEWNLAP